MSNRLVYSPSKEQLELAAEVAKELNITSRQKKVIDEAIEVYSKESLKELNLVYYGVPKAQGRARLGRAQHFYDPSDSFKQSIIEQIIRLMPTNFKPISTYLLFDVKFYLPIPKTSTASSRILMELGVIRHSKKPDKDNLEKLLYDALKGVLFCDDSIIVGGTGEKFYSCKPRVEIKLYYKE